MHAPAVGVDAVRELPQDLTAVGDGVVAAQPVGPYPVRWHMQLPCQVLQVVRLGMDGGCGPGIGFGQRMLGHLRLMELCGRDGQVRRERFRLLDLLVEGEHGTQVELRRVLEER